MRGSDGRAARRATIGLVALHALLFHLAFPSAGLWPLAFVSTIPLALAAELAPRRRDLLLAVLLVHGPAWLWADRYVAAISIAGLPALALYMTGWSAIHALLLRRLLQGRLPAAVVLPAAQIVIETLRGDLVLGGYPWYLLGQPLVESAILVQSADLLGAPIASLLAAAVSGAALDAAGYRRRTIGRVRLRRAATAVGVLLALDLAYGAWRLAETDRATRPGPAVLVLQTNLPQDNKIGWPWERQVEDFGNWLQASADALAAEQAAGRPVDLLAWPETMLPGPGIDPETIDYLRAANLRPGDLFAGALDALVERGGVPLLVGSLATEGLRVAGQRFVWDRQYNAAYLLGTDGSLQRSEKIYLTPFGERMPWIDAWPWLEDRLLALGASGMSFDLDAAEEPRRLGPIGAGEAATLIAAPICFEATVARVCRRMLGERATREADLLVNLTNDGWFGRHDSGRAAHAQLARFRCIENRVPMIRCANTGFSMLIDSAGRVSAVAGAGRYGEGRRQAVLRTEPRLDARQPFARWVGDLPSRLLTILALVVAFVAPRRAA